MNYFFDLNKGPTNSNNLPPIKEAIFNPINLKNKNKGIISIN